MIDFTNLKDIDRPLVIGHRGAPRAARENTIASFEAAIAVGVDAVEFDVRRTADGVLVVHHDASVSPEHPLISECGFDALKDAARTKGYEVPTLDEVLAVCSDRVSVDVELKETGYEETVVAAVLTRFDARHAMFKSFQEKSVKALCSIEPGVFAGLLIGYRPDFSRGSGLKRKFSVRVRAQKTGARFVSPHWRLVRSGFLRKMEEASLPVFAWTANDIRVVRRLIRQGITGIITDVPDRVLALGP